jgi:DNA-binding PadR family transcriptional regulator
MSRSHRLRHASPLDEGLLRILTIAPASGHAVVTQLRAAWQASDPDVARSTYLGLHRLERQGLLTSEWQAVPGRSLAAKYYRVTPRGRHWLGQPLERAPVLAVHPLTMLLVMAIIGATDTAASPVHARQLHLTILLDSQVPIAQDDLRHVSMDVIRIFGAIGVQAECVFEGLASRTTSPSGQRRLDGFVVHAVIVAGRPGPPSLHELFLGMTPPGDGSGTDILLFYEQIQELAQIQQRPPSSILALVVAHEIGHVLLPPPAHSTAGVMQAPWDRKAMDQADNHGLLFTAHQGELIRQRLDHGCEIMATR